jgi:type IV pilus assembly protein PilY1
MGGQLWRFDIFNGTGPGSGLVAGGVIANLGAKAGGASATADNRRFYNAPDVSLIQRRGADPYYNIAIGSGFRGHPLDLNTNDRFYSIRDRSPYTKLNDYSGVVPVLDASLPEVTTQTVLSTAPGWKFNITRNGEKILAESTTVNGVILFPSFQPGAAGGASGPCYPTNTNRVYALGVDSGKAVLDFNDDGTNDLSTDLNQTGIVGQINVGILQQTGVDSDGDGVPDSEENGNTVCLAGVEVLSKCVSAGGTIRTFWRRNVD